MSTPDTPTPPSLPELAEVVLISSRKPSINVSLRLEECHDRNSPATWRVLIWIDWMDIDNYDPNNLDMRTREAIEATSTILVDMGGLPLAEAKAVAIDCVLAIWEEKVDATTMMAGIPTAGGIQ